MAKSSPKSMQRLDKCVSHLTGLSRQQASKIIRAGDVSVDGEILTDAAQKISIEAQIIIADFNDDEQETTCVQDAFKHRVFVLNKPYDFICADRDKHKRLVVGLFNSELKCNELHTAGRLDVDTTGLLIVTDDGDLIHRITSPKKEVSKLYYAILDRAVPEHAVRQFAQGIKHPEEDKRYQPASLILLDDDEQGRHRACVQLSEGRYHEVKRLFEMVDCEVQMLSRLAIGNLTLGNLGIGNYTTLDEDHLAAVFEEHTYTPQECLELIERQERALRSGPLTFIPEEYRPQPSSTLVQALADENVSVENASHSQTISETVAAGAIAATAFVAGQAFAQDINGESEAQEASTTNAKADQKEAEADPYFDASLDTEMDELYGEGGFVEDNWADANSSTNADGYEDDEYEVEENVDSYDEYEDDGESDGSDSSDNGEDDWGDWGDGGDGGE